MRNLLSAFLLLCAIPGQGFAEPAETELLQRVRVDYAALLQARADFARLRNSGALGSAEEADYTVWIRQMGEQVTEDCAALKRVMTTPLPQDLPCNDLSASGPAPAMIDTDAESTEAEKTASMIEQLNGSLGEFDERLLQEQDRIKARTPRTEQAGGQSGNGMAGGEMAGDSDDTGQGEKQAAQEGDDGEQSGSSDTGKQGEPQPGSKRPGSKTTGTKTSGTKWPGGKSPGDKGAVPDDIPDGSDDDVVARQLREAAEKETDPELKKKLWEEYRRYKVGICRFSIDPAGRVRHHRGTTECGGAGSSAKGKRGTGRGTAARCFDCAV